MKRRAVWGLILLLLAVSALGLAPSVLRASDHADPLKLEEPESNITDLFFYPKGDQMILILNVRRALLNPKPYNLSPFEYVVHIDLTAPLSFDDIPNRARYGGTVIDGSKLKDDVRIGIRLNDDTTMKTFDVKGLNRDKIKLYTGVRDDPFIFPRFFKRNIIAMVMSIPMSEFPAGQRDFILWGSTIKDGKFIDHVGRSNRTQQARFDSLNTLPVQQHVEEIMRLMKKWDDAFKTLNGFKEWYSKAIAGVVQYLVQIRKYDVQPDVMIYSSRFPVGFPNGRLLTDDVGAITCSTGDCILQDLSFIEGGWPRATVNDKPFLEEWPYLAEPWPETQEPAPSTKSILPYIILLVLIFAIVSWLLVSLFLKIFMWLWMKFWPKPKPKAA